MSLWWLLDHGFKSAFCICWILFEMFFPMDVRNLLNCKAPLTFPAVHGWCWSIRGAEADDSHIYCRKVDKKREKVPGETSVGGWEVGSKLGSPALKALFKGRASGPQEWPLMVYRMNVCEASGFRGDSLQKMLGVIHGFAYRTKHLRT